MPLRCYREKDLPPPLLDDERCLLPRYRDGDQDYAIDGVDVTFDVTPAYRAAVDRWLNETDVVHAWGDGNLTLYGEETAGTYSPLNPPQRHGFGKAGLVRLQRDADLDGIPDGHEIATQHGLHTYFTGRGVVLHPLAIDIVIALKGTTTGNASYTILPSTIERTIKILKHGNASRAVLNPDGSKGVHAHILEEGHVRLPDERHEWLDDKGRDLLLEAFPGSPSYVLKGAKFPTMFFNDPHEPSGWADRFSRILALNASSVTGSDAEWQERVNEQTNRSTGPVQLEIWERSEARTFLHEVGHLLGLPHTSGVSIMYSSQVDPSGGGTTPRKIDFTMDEWHQAVEWLHHRGLWLEAP